MAFITLTEAKEYLHYDSSDEDVMIGSMLMTSKLLCADVARLSIDMQAAIDNDDDDGDETVRVREVMRVAVLYTLGYLFEHREEADHHGLVLTLRSLLFGIREGMF